jgi:hypothetical protein
VCESARLRARRNPGAGKFISKVVDIEQKRRRQDDLMARTGFRNRNSSIVSGCSKPKRKFQFISVEGTMKRVMLGLALLAIVLPIAARADGINLTNQAGTVTILASGISSYGSQLRSFNGVVAPKGHALGTVSYATGALLTGDVWNGGTFSSTGSIFDVVGQGDWMKTLTGLSGEKGKVPLFTGEFVGTIQWNLVNSNKQFHEYQLIGDIQGTLWTGRVVTGNTTQTIYTYWNQERIDNKGSVHLGQIHLNTPEPNTLGLLGGGLLAMAAMFRRVLPKA